MGQGGGLIRLGSRAPEDDEPVMCADGYFRQRKPWGDPKAIPVQGGGASGWTKDMYDHNRALAEACLEERRCQLAQWTQEHWIRDWSRFSVEVHCLVLNGQVLAEARRLGNGDYQPRTRIESGPAVGRMGSWGFEDPDLRVAKGYCVDRVARAAKTETPTGERDE